MENVGEDKLLRTKESWDIGTEADVQLGFGLRVSDTIERVPGGS